MEVLTVEKKKKIITEKYFQIVSCDRSSVKTHSV